MNINKYSKNHLHCKQCEVGVCSFDKEYDRSFVLQSSFVGYNRRSGLALLWHRFWRRVFY